MTKERDSTNDQNVTNNENATNAKRQRRQARKRHQQETFAAVNRSASQLGTRTAASRDMADDPWSEQHRLRYMIWRFILGCIVLGVTIAISPGVDVESWWAVPVAVLFTSLLSVVLRPVLIRVTLIFGWFGAIFLALFGSFVVMYAVIEISPGFSSTSPLAIFVATWVYAVLMTVAQWVLISDNEDVFLVSIMRHSTKRKIWGSLITDQDRELMEAGGHPVTGVVFVQLDGLPAPVLDWAVRSGNLPTLARWIRSGEYSWEEWRARVPSTTPVSQAGILHGTSNNMPGFRWYERDSGSLIVANHPPDAALIESRISDGRGLLADGGISISNLFSGDAATRMLVMSEMGNVRRGLGPTQSYAQFLGHPAGITRALVLMIGEMIKEKYQALAQIKRNVQPRVKRKGSYVFLRGVTNVLLRDLNTSLVVESMMKGAKSIYVDYVDYDEIAHHAGVQRKEALSALEGLDQVLANLERVTRYAPRPYSFVILSDHGQSQGATFRQRFDQPLEDLVQELISGANVVSATGAVEDWGPLNTFLSELQTQRTMTGSITRQAMKSHSVDGAVQLGPSGLGADDGVDNIEARPEVVVTGSGNLGAVVFPREATRLTLTEINERWPHLIPGLVRHPGISFVVVQTERSGPVAVGEFGVHTLETGFLEGQDPLALFGPHAAADFLRVAQFDNAPDILINSLFEPHTDEVAAFEELVGCHGGVGGWQNRAVLVYPSSWVGNGEIDGGEFGGGNLEPGLGSVRLYSAEAVHQQLVSWLELLGHRQDFGSEK